MCDRTNQQLIAENEELRGRIAVLERMEIEGKRVEDELRRSRRILSEAERLSHTGAWEWDLCTNQWTFSDEWLNIHGCHRHTLTPEELLPIAHPDDREATEQAFDDVRNRIKPYEMEHRIIRQDTGEVRVIRARGQYVVNAAGKVTRVNGFAVDITEQQRAEEVRQEKEARFLEAQEVARLGFFLLDISQGKWISSPVLEQIFCIPPDYTRTIEGWGDLVHPDDRQGMLDYFSREVIEKGEPFDREYRIVRCGDKQVRWVHGLGRLQFNEEGHPIFMLATIQDITERKQAEKALQEAHDELEQQVKERTVELSKANEELVFFQKFAESSGEGFGMSDLDGRIVYANPSLCRLFGEKGPEDVVGKNVSTYYPAEYVHKRENELVPAVLREGRWCIEQMVLPRHGTPLQTLQSTFLIRDENGNPLRIAVVISDITERKRAQEALEREHRTLKHLLQSSDHERQLIAYETHDELAQQLAGAIMQFQAFFHLKDTKPEDAVRAFDVGMTMLQQGHFEARRLISGVRPPILDEEGIVAAVAHLVNEERREKGPTIEFQATVEFDRLTPILENAIYRIAQEALANACRHSEAKKVHVELMQCGDQIRIEVRDRGVGFKPEDVGESRFGLAGIRERARLLGGRAIIESEAGKGTRIVVDLPIVLRRPEDEPPDESEI